MSSSDAIKLAPWVAVVIIVLVGHMFLPSHAHGNGVPLPASVPGAPLEHVRIVYDGHSFTPGSVTVLLGGSVSFTSTAGDMWVASDPHPLHEGYSGIPQSKHCPDPHGTAFDQCSAGKNFTFTFEKTGAWGYHDHINDDVGGVVYVVEPSQVR